MAISKRILSGSTNGRPIKVVQTATAGTLLHTADASLIDEVTIYLSNTSAADVVVVIEFGGVTSPDDHIKVTVPAADSILAVPGIPLSGGLIARAFAASANVITAFGYVNRIG